MSGTLGDRIRQVRLRLDLSQEEFAEAIGVETKASVSNYEKGERSPSYEVLASIAQVGNVTLDWLITGKDMTEKKLREVIDDKNKEIEELENKVYQLSTEVAQLNKVAEAAEQYSKVKKKHISDRWKGPKK